MISSRKNGYQEYFEESVSVFSYTGILWRNHVLDNILTKSIIHKTEKPEEKCHQFWPNALLKCMCTSYLLRLLCWLVVSFRTDRGTSNQHSIWRLMRKFPTRNTRKLQKKCIVFWVQYAYVIPGGLGWIPAIPRIVHMFFMWLFPPVTKTIFLSLLNSSPTNLVVLGT